jgi:hypothetical protein
MKNFKFNVFLKKHLGSIFCQVLLRKKGFLAIFRAKSAGILPFWCHFRTFQTEWKAYLTSLTLPTTTTAPGTPPANSRCTKQFLSRTRSLYLFLSEGAELLTTATA